MQASSEQTETTVPFERLRAFIHRSLVALGLPDADAMTVATLMAEADLQGSDGHGVTRLPSYARRIRAGGVNVKPNIRVAREMASTALIDGDNGMGHLVMKRAAELAVEKARATGIGWVNSQFSNHAGPASLYAGMPLAHDMIGLYFAVGNANHLPPWGGLDMLLSTNPIAAAIPAGREKPIILDMATTVAAYGKVKTRALLGQTMPEGWMIDRQGKPLTDPKRADEGMLLPLGGMEAGYKGYGLALIIGLLAGTLGGAAMGKDVIDFNHDRLQRYQYRTGYRGDQCRGVRRHRGLQGQRRYLDRRPARQQPHAGRRADFRSRRAQPRNPQQTPQRRHPAGAGLAARTGPTRRRTRDCQAYIRQAHTGDAACASIDGSFPASRSACSQARWAPSPAIPTSRSR